MIIINTKIIFPIFLLLIAVACIGFASAADTHVNSTGIDESQNIEIDTSNTTVDSGIKEVVDAGVSEVQNSDTHTIPVKEVNNTDNGRDTACSDKSVNTSSNNTIKGPTKKPTLDLKGPKKNNLKIQGPKIADEIIKEDQEVAKYYKWAIENKVNNAAILLKIFRTHNTKDTAKIAAKVLSKINCHDKPFDTSDIRDMLRCMYEGRYESKYGYQNSPTDYEWEIRAILVLKNPKFDPFSLFGMMFFEDFD